MSLNVIGISAFYHDSACCVLKDGQLVAAAQEERFSRKKNDPDLPKEAFMYCLEESRLSIADIDCIAYYEDPVKKCGRQLWSGIKKLSMKDAYKLNPMHVENKIREQLGFKGQIKYYDHHLSHAASSYFYSGFDSSAILTIDGVGEWATTTYGLGNEKGIEIFEEVSFPNSLGLLYSTITSFLGFSVNSGEYKVMGLAPYGAGKYIDEIRSLIEMKKKGQYTLNMDYFDFLKGERMYSEKMALLFEMPPREKESKIMQVHSDIAKSLQIVLEEVMLDKAIYLSERTGSENLCMAGGVALNCVANAKVLKKGPFKKLFVQPAANDAGCCLGAAALAHHDISGQKPNERMSHVYLGPGYGANGIERILSASSLKYADYRGRTEEMVKIVAQKIADGKVIGWFHGRMEFGPRSLGARSILADPRRPDMRDRINAMVKKREAFRPFAPAVLESKMHEHFDIDHPSPFMLETCQVLSKIDLPAITHVDGSARVQTVNRETNPWFWALLTAMDELTGCPILLNTSFNVRDEPIVNTPEEALICFITTDIDCLVLEDFIIDNDDNNTDILDMINQNFLERREFEINPNVYTFI